MIWRVFSQIFNDFSSLISNRKSQHNAIILQFFCIKKKFCELTLPRGICITRILTHHEPHYQNVNYNYELFPTIEQNLSAFVFKNYRKLASFQLKIASICLLVITKKEMSPFFRSEMQKQMTALEKEIEEVKIDATKHKTDLEKLRVSLKQAQYIY